MSQSFQVLLGLVFSSCLVARVLAQAPARSEVIDRILPAVSTPSLANLRAAEQAWQGQVVAEADVLTRYAMAWAYASNNKFPTAFETMELIPAAARHAGPLRRFWIWLSLKVKQDEFARAELQSLIDEFAARASNPPTEKDLEDMKFAARCVTYLEQIAERDEPLHPQQARSWRLKLEALPATWQEELPALQAGVAATHSKRQLELRASHKTWHSRTTQELTSAQQHVARLAQKEAAAKAPLTQAIAAHQKFSVTAGPQLQGISVSIGQLATQRAAIRRPSPPGGKGKGDDRKDDEEDREYQQELNEYHAKLKAVDVQVASYQSQAAVIQQQEVAHQQDILEKKGDHVKAEAPLQIAEKNETRLKLLLAERATWDTPGTLATLRALDAYVTLDPAREVMRIQQARK